VVPLTAGDVGGGEMRERAIFEVEGWIQTTLAGEVGAELVLRDQAFGDEVRVGDVDT